MPSLRKDKQTETEKQTGKEKETDRQKDKQKDKNRQTGRKMVGWLIQFYGWLLLWLYPFINTYLP